MDLIRSLLSSPDWTTPEQIRAQSMAVEALPWLEKIRDEQTFEIPLNLAKNVIEILEYAAIMNGNTDMLKMLGRLTYEIFDRQLQFSIAFNNRGTFCINPFHYPG